ncbi:heavy-metal-associated domain-containing protein [Haloterrigena sp. H1]|uniref:CopZ family metallochaperone n=1 Tax=Haloterrigena sp. H1 TaxID=2552943 RepID=UPI00110E09E4|nr:cation transporter [Haloterrigena sp. H1]TMT77913.1 heavy-metal-associated domain-containing protein [Haloterrigena sp. H1]TMT78488.1 heavy-metal-associated domain-containing protein [Haloterrigena sp. H1]TMT80411.1 heavy-metal-associated domain-containing protein [Haloterrigena sp. H1]
MSQTITVEGMSCEHCEQSVEETLANVQGVQSVEVDLDAAQATVEGDAATQDLVSAVDEAGYDASA